MDSAGLLRPQIFVLLALSYEGSELASPRIPLLTLSFHGNSNQALTIGFDGGIITIL